jgi:hypothetical protein
MPEQLFILTRFPFDSGDGVMRYRIMGELIDDDVAFAMPVDKDHLPPCIDCFGELGWSEPVYGKGARQCMQCGSVFLVKPWVIDEFIINHKLNRVIFVWIAIQVILVLLYLYFF